MAKTRNVNETADVQPTGLAQEVSNQTSDANRVGSDEFLVTSVEGEPQYEYYWAATNRTHPSSYERMRRLGYEPVPFEEGVAPFAEKTSDGYITTGDLILMRTSRENAEHLRKRKVETFLSRMSAEEEKMLSVGSDVEGVETSVVSSGRRSFYIANNPLAKR